MTARAGNARDATRAVVCIGFAAFEIWGHRAVVAALVAIRPPKRGSWRRLWRQHALCSRRPRSKKPSADAPAQPARQSTRAYCVGNDGFPTPLAITAMMTAITQTAKASIA
jgi:hypothetical protein